MIEQVVDKLASTDNRGAHDFEKGGIIYCGECKSPKQAWIDWLPDADGNPQKRLVPVMCRCRQEAYEREREEHKREKFQNALTETRERFGIQPRCSVTNTFAEDDAADSPISRTMREYVAQWSDMRERNMGIILYGTKGTGKSYYASCIVHALEEKGVMTAMTTTALLLNIMQGEWDKAAVLDNINRFQLLVLDDLGAERETTYGAELMYTIIDSRYRAKLPLIVTTNLDLADMRDDTDIWRSRLYDRIIEMCPIVVRMDGDSRRNAIAKGKKHEARECLKRASKKETATE